MKPVVSIGNANVDHFFVVERLPRKDEGVVADEYYVAPGGSAGNFAVALARLGINTRFIGYVGDDSDADFIINSFLKDGVDTSGIARVKELPTGKVIILIEKSTGNKRMVAYRGANEYLLDKGINLDLIKNAEWIHISSVRVCATLNILKHAKKLGINTSYDPGASVLSKDAELIIKLAPLMDILFLNTRELAILRRASGRKIVNLLLENGVSEVVVKKGERGATVFTLNKKRHKNAFKVKCIDATGAGDAFNAGYIYATIKKLNIDDKLVIANAVAAIKVTRRGARSAPSLYEVVSFLKARGIACRY